MNTKMLWKQASSKLILDTPQIYNRNQKIDLKILFGLTHHLTRQKFFFERSTNIFQGLIDYIKFFNRKTVKISYSSMQNMSKIYKGHNSKITFTSCNQLTLCNCWVKEECPMDGKCQTMDAVYNCSVTLRGLQTIYFGLVEGKRKKRYFIHKNLFNHKGYSHETAFSSYMWYIKGTFDVTDVYYHLSKTTQIFK